MFLVLAGLLVVIALIFIVPPLLGKSRESVSDPDQANLQASRLRLEDLERDMDDGLVEAGQLDPLKEETETTLMLERRQDPEIAVKTMSNRFYLACTAVVCLCVPALAMLVYLSVGTPAALQFSVAGGQAQDPAGQTLETLVNKLEQRLAEQPQDEQGWLILAQTEMILGHYAKAVTAMENLYRLTGDAPDVLARYADALTMANDGRFNDKADQLITRALELDPDHVHALWLSGMQAYQEGDYAAAVRFFTRVRPRVTDAENLSQLDDLVRSAIERGNLEVEIPAARPATAGAGIEVAVRLDPSLQASVTPEDTLFIFARAAEGPPMPLAVSRGQAGDLPVTVRLDDSMAMMPDLVLSAFDQVVVSARISGSGQPVAQPGDAQGESALLDPSQTNRVEIVIDQLVE